MNLEEKVLGEMRQAYKKLLDFCDENSGSELVALLEGNKAQVAETIKMMEQNFENDTSPDKEISKKGADEIAAMLRAIVAETKKNI